MSYEKIVDGNLTPMDREAHEKVWGRFNDPFPNMVEITSEEFAQSGFFRWSIAGTEYRQIDPKRINPKSILSPIDSFLSVTSFFLKSPTESGFAMSSDYWSKKVRYFKFALCHHTYKELSSSEASKKGVKHFGNCYHVCECTKCGNIWSYDSSG
jgi:hypothetical protein